MSRSRHFPAYDWDCDDMELEPEPRPSRPRVAHRKVRERSVAGELERDGTKQLVECPFRDEWPTLEACLGCKHFRGYSLDPTGKESFVSCGRVEEILCPLPRNVSPRSRALRTRVVDLMSDPVCAREFLTTPELARLLRDRRVSGLPVVDAAGKPVGVVSKTDLVEQSANGSEREAATVSEIMTPVVFSLPESASVVEAAELMAKRGVHRLPVTSRSGHVVGVITALDIARWLATAENGTGREAPCPAAL